ncbi:MAG TPA: phosphatidylserine decarboxylase [Anaerolineae bacterium]|nr:phosphatidylserine decarboxylase [Anaerolineae bacterium]
MFSGVFAAWREVRSLFLALATASLLALLRRQSKLFLLASSLLAWLCYFFRDPDRFPPATGPEWILAPADGKVTAVELIHEPQIFKGSARRISIFLSLFDVHVQRAPYQGDISAIHYEAGGFAPAFLKDTHLNEYNLITLSTPHGLIGVKQIAGILARRIVCWPSPDQFVIRGERLGLIKFGSRVDLLLPPSVEVLISVGEQVFGGQPIVARWPVEEQTW